MNPPTPSSPAPTAPTLPSRPRLALRLGFAGSRRLVTDEELAARPLPDDEPARTKELEERANVVAERTRLEGALPQVLETLGRTLAVIAPGAPVAQGREPRVAAFYSQQCPLLRLVTGLCEGADALAARLLATVNIPPDPNATCEPDTRCLETELAAVIPFDAATYRGSRPASYQGEYDRQLEQCAWLLELDGIYEKPVPDTPTAKNRRARAYRAQAAFLLRQTDVLIAAANPDQTGKAGGTFETVREALAFELPVVFIHTGRDGDNVFLINPQDDLHSVLAESPPDNAEWQSDLRRWVREITSDPDAGLKPVEAGHDRTGQQGDELLEEFFDCQETPPRDANGQRSSGFREQAWAWFERRFRPALTFESDPPLEPFSTFRKRATDLNYHYSGQYRGAFLLNYALAIAAVLLATFCLTLLGTAGHTGVGQQVAELIDAAGHSVHESVEGPARGTWLLPVLLLLAAMKLVIVLFILRNTRLANGQHWNDRAVDYRYLAERLRAMYYLPLAGIHQPPAAAPPQFASRVARQSAIDWVFDAFVRAISPADLPQAQPKAIPSHDGRGMVSVGKLLTLDPGKTAALVRDAWIGEQAKYHERNARTMHAMHHRMETVATFLSWAVIVVVALDLLLIGGKMLHLLPAPWATYAKAATPWLIFVSAVLPAVVAALGGVIFQSECQRLAERSEVMRTLLAGRGGLDAPPLEGRWKLADTLAERLAERAESPDTDPGSAAHDVLRMTERIATDFVQEAAEWSVLYAKEVRDPG